MTTFVPNISNQVGDRVKSFCSKCHVFLLRLGGDGEDNEEEEDDDDSIVLSEAREVAVDDNETSDPTGTTAHVAMKVGKKEKEININMNVKLKETTNQLMVKVNTLTSSNNELKQNLKHGVGNKAD